MLELATHPGPATVALGQALGIRWSSLGTVLFTSAQTLVLFPPHSRFLRGPQVRAHAQSCQTIVPLLFTLLHMHSALWLPWAVVRARLRGRTRCPLTSALCGGRLLCI